MKLAITRSQVKKRIAEKNAKTNRPKAVAKKKSTAPGNYQGKKRKYT